MPAGVPALCSRLLDIIRRFVLAMNTRSRAKHYLRVPHTETIVTKKVPQNNIKSRHSRISSMSRGDIQ